MDATETTLICFRQR